ncbi:MAG: hypothetical protein GQ574_00015 [Crocinitomix sp.]|nr:hypothetical protein [Crocinitomix sp.]
MKYITALFLLFTLIIFSSCSYAQDSELERIQSADRSSKIGFQENKGQFEDINHAPVPYVLFKLESAGLNVWITNTGLTYHIFDIEKKYLPKDSLKVGSEEKIKIMHSRRIDMILKNASIKKENISTSNIISQGEHNYYLGNCPAGVFDVKTYEEILIKEIYAGIDWKIYITQSGELKYDFIVHPNANPGLIKLVYEGYGSIETKPTQLHFETDLGTLSEGELICFQNGEKVRATYQFHKNDNLTHLGAGNFSNGNEQPVMENSFSVETTIDLSDYDESQELIIDPELVWGTCYGGNSYEGIISITTDQDGSLFATGYCHSTDFPVMDTGTYFQESATPLETFVLKFNNNSNLIWATYYGGSENEKGSSITVDLNNDIWLTGYTLSEDLPTFAPPMDGFFQPTIAGDRNLFIAKFNNSGEILLATYYGGSYADIGDAITTDLFGNVFITGTSHSDDFPLADNGTYFDDTFEWTSDLFILKFNAEFEREWATYYGGIGQEEGTDITCDLSGNVLVTGLTTSSDFETEDCGGYYQTSSNAREGFLLKFDNIGNRIWATFLGGNWHDEGTSVLTDQNDNIFVSGVTSSTDFPVLDAGTYFQEENAGGKDAFITKFDSDHNLIWGSYYGGYNNDGIASGVTDTPDQLAIDQCGNVYFVFSTFHYTGEEDIPLYTPGDCYFYDIVESGRHLFLTRFQNDGTLDFASYIARGFRTNIALDGDNNIFLGSEVGYIPIDDPYLPNPGGGAYHQLGNGIEDCTFFKLIDTLVATKIQPEDTLCACDGIATVSLCGTPPYSYKWSTGLEIIDTSANVISLTDLCPGEYWVEVKAGCYEIDTIYFTFEGYISGLELDLGADTTVCNDIFWTLDAGNPGAEYSWHDMSTEQFFTAYTSGTYWVTVYDGLGCSLTDSITLSIGEIVVDLGNDTTICYSEDTLILNAGFAGASFSWQDESDEQF